MSEKDESSGGRNSRRAKEGHTGHERKLSPLKATDVIIDCFPEACPCCAQSDIDAHSGRTTDINSLIFLNLRSTSLNTVYLLVNVVTAKKQ
ncbi:hypothetical protein GTG28_16820 [Vibrio sp. OCN044]|uniref:Uncharacterized protein n=1 Tax=Vibrio tetraodonis subsp. pristinus TaxID=2695891 RepID=A0A6L8M4X8_9VIBR|nr:hypothetical protein [Vibrio tetraodonis subsp. pristinus]